jgi:hypothetical protein
MLEDVPTGSYSRVELGDDSFGLEMAIVQTHGLRLMAASMTDAGTEAGLREDTK